MNNLLELTPQPNIGLLPHKKLGNHFKLPSDKLPCGDEIFPEIYTINRDFDVISGIYGSLMIYIYYESHKNVLFHVNHFSAINVHIYMKQLITNRARGTVIQDQTTRANRFLRPGYGGSIRTDLPMIVIGKKRKALMETISTGQLFCIGKVYLKTHKGMIRIR